MKTATATEPLQAAKLIAERFGIVVEESRRNRQTALKLSDYSAHAKLPVKFLRYTFKLEETPKGIAIPYLDEDGNQTGVQMRHRLEKPKGKDSRFSWQKGSKPCLYGAWALKRWAEKKAPRVIILEGASDVQVLWFNKIPALGVPGASAFKRDWAKLLFEFDEIAIIKEPGDAGESFVKSIAEALRDGNYQGRRQSGVAIGERPA